LDHASIPTLALHSFSFPFYSREAELSSPK
jgi:hypothetical protein